jgi:hypothetical protein
LKDWGEKDRKNIAKTKKMTERPGKGRTKTKKKKHCKIIIERQGTVQKKISQLMYVSLSSYIASACTSHCSYSRVFFSLTELFIVRFNFSNVSSTQVKNYLKNIPCYTFWVDP